MSVFGVRGGVWLFFAFHLRVKRTKRYKHFKDIVAQYQNMSTAASPFLWVRECLNESAVSTFLCGV